MNIQFLRLSFTLLLALFAYSWLLSTIWETFAPAKPIITVEQAFKLHANKEQQLFKSIPEDVIQLPKAMFEQIKAGQQIQFIDGKNNVYFYNYRDGNVEILGPIQMDNSAINNQRYLTSLYFIGVIVILLFWFRPLFLELRLLSKKALEFSKTAHWQAFSIRQSSPIFPVVEVFNQMGQRIEELVEQYKGISRMIGHEIRTPLARTQFSLATIDDEEHKEELSSIQEDIDEIAALTEEFLNIAKLEYTQAQLPLSLVEIKPLISDLVARFQRTTRHQIKLDIDDNLKVFIDKTSFMRMSQNLIGNALKHCNSQINVRIIEHEQHFTLDVCDDGDGFKEAEKALKPYYQEDSSKDGFGLGLAIIKMIAKWYQGNISITKCPTLNGAKVSFSWPKKLK
ncbi:ATP-binding protein [Thalassotalea sp. PLHSN55]|uniref:ATP-binding protein n=1 Tax=Thalassotalea sp. PLHSN55 TaxID=3435888 RepID=UPI003F8419F2